ncbi:MAG: sigma-70 family RNA polymerase sigma factor [Isosphaerales bacterium]
MALSSQKWQLDRYRPLLRLQARKLELDLRLRRRFDSSDLVQETMLKAHEGLEKFGGGTEAELIGWLQEILGNVVADEVWKARALKRDVALERSLDDVVAESSARMNDYLTANGPSPSEQAERREELLRLAVAIDQLPPDQRDVVIQRDLLGSPVREIADLLERTEKSVAGLLLRGRRRLRELLEEDK